MTDHGVEIEECGFEKASLYQTFTFWVEVVTVVDDNYYPTGVKSQTVIFTAATSAGKFTSKFFKVPPGGDEDGK